MKELRKTLNPLDSMDRVIFRPIVVDLHIHNNMDFSLGINTSCPE